MSFYRSMLCIALLTISVALAPAEYVPNAHRPSHNNDQDGPLEFFEHIILPPGNRSTRTAMSFPMSEVAITGSGPSPGGNGYCVTFDRKLTQTDDYFSMEVGRARGVSCISSLDGSVAHQSFVISFAGKDGDLSLSGIYNLRTNTSTMAIVGGTGEFYRSVGLYGSQIIRSDDTVAVARVMVALHD